MKNHDLERIKEVAANQLLEEKKYWKSRLAGLQEKSYFPYDFAPAAVSSLYRNFHFAAGGHTRHHPVTNENLHKRFAQHRGSPRRGAGKDENQGEIKVDHLTFTWEGEFFQRLMKLRNGSDPRLHIILTAGLVALLAKYTHSRDIIIGTPIDKQEDMGVEFINTVLPIRVELHERMTFKELLLEIRTIINEAIEHRNYPIEHLVSEMKMEAGGNGFALFDTAILLGNLQDKSYIDHLPIHLIFSFRRVEDAVFGTLEHRFSAYETQTIRKIVARLTRLLEICLGNVNIALADIDLLTPEEKRQLLDFNNTRFPYPLEKTIYELFEEQVMKTPEHVALISGNDTWTYRQLNREANRFAAALREKGVNLETIVGILTERSAAEVCAIIGVLKAGGAYLPIDPNYPPERKLYILQDSGAYMLLTSQNPSEIGEWEGNIFQLETLDTKENNIESPIGVTSEAGPANLAYIIYTSGSTGRPKGVMVEHRGLVNYSCWAVKKYIKNEPAVFPLYTSTAFDLTVTSIFPPLISGNAIAVYRSENKEFLIDKIAEENRVNVIKVTPVHLKLMRDNNISNSSFKRFIVGGEQLESRLAKDIDKDFGGGVEIYNEYGPTEAVVGCMIHRFDPGKDVSGVVPIGVPADNVNILLLDNNRKPVPVGLIGEIYIGGHGLARGYINRPELTAEKFDHDLSDIFHYHDEKAHELHELMGSWEAGKQRSELRSISRLHPETDENRHNRFAQHIGSPRRGAPGRRRQKIYKTGDLAWMMQDGNIEFLGRIDHQVKIRGFRIELEEIQHRLLQHDEINDCVVLAREEKGSKYLCAYLVSDEEINISGLRNFLYDKLPDYMVPAYFVQLDEIPLTPNGKKDLKALPEPDEGSMDNAGEYKAPKNEVEQILVNIWQDVMGVERVGIDDDYFNLGGDSIKSILISSRLRKYNLKLDISDLFQYHTIAQLSTRVAELREVADQGVVEGEVSLTPIQHWFFRQNYKDSHHFNQSVLLYRPEGFKSELLEKVFHKLVDHHDALRMVFKIGHSRVRQFNRGLEGPLVDMRVYEIKEKDHEKIIEAKCNHIQASMDLARGPLVKLGVFKTCKGDYLLVAIHHLVVDTVSLSILFEDFTSLYQQLEKGVTGDNLDIQLKTTSYKEWAGKLYEYSSSEALMDQIKYWRSLEQTRPLPLFEGSDSPGCQAGKRGRISFELPKEYTEKLLKQVNNAYNTEINDILLTGLGLAVNDWTGVEKIPVMMEGHGREEIIPGIDVSRTVGWFTTIYPVVLEVTGKHNFSTVIKNTKEMLRRIPNKGIGYGILKYLTAEEHKRDMVFHLRPEISFNYLGQADVDLNNEFFRLAEISGGDVVSSSLQMIEKLAIIGVILKGKLMMSMNYDTEACDETRMGTFVDLYEKHLRQIIDHCTARKETELTPSDYGSAIADQEVELVFDVLNEITLDS